MSGDGEIRRARASARANPIEGQIAAFTTGIRLLRLRDVEKPGVRSERRTALQSPSLAREDL